MYAKGGEGVGNLQQTGLFNLRSAVLGLLNTLTGDMMETPTQVPPMLL